MGAISIDFFNQLDYCSLDMLVLLSNPLLRDCNRNPLGTSVICVACLSFALMISFVPFPPQAILTLCLDKKNFELDCLIVVFMLGFLVKRFQLQRFMLVKFFNQ